MIRKILIGCMFTMFVMTLSIHAKETNPGGINLLNPAYLEASLNEDTLRTKHSIELKADSTYALGIATNASETFEIYLDDTLYIEDEPSSPEICDTHANYAKCIIETDETMTLDFVLYGNEVARNYLMEQDTIMLQKGSDIDWYEPFIPLNDSDPVITSGGTIYLDYANPIDVHDLIGDEITAYDEIDGDLTDEIVITDNTYADSPSEVGVYEVVFEVKDSANNKAQLNLEVHVIDQNPPIISGPETISIPIDESKPTDQIIDENYTFYDNHDGPIETYEIIEDSYSDNTDTLGTYSVTFEVQDSSENTTTKTVDITLYDDVAPVIEGENELTMYLSDAYDSIEDILDAYTITDNYTESDDLILTINDTDLTSLKQRGSYTVELLGEDCSENKVTKTVTLHIVDDIKPVIEGENFVSLSYTKTFDIDEFIASLNVSDNHDELSSEDIYVKSSNYEQTDDEIGSYAITFAVRDESDNKTTHSLVIETIDDVAPEFVMAEPIIIAPSITLSQDAIYEHFLKDETLKTFNPVEMTVLNDEYTDNKTTPGEYAYEVMFHNDEGETMQHSTMISVNEIDESSHTNNALIALSLLLTIATTAIIIKRFR